MKKKFSEMSILTRSLIKLGIVIALALYTWGLIMATQAWLVNGTTWPLITLGIIGASALVSIILHGLIGSVYQAGYRKGKAEATDTSPQIQRLTAELRQTREEAANNMTAKNEELLDIQDQLRVAEESRVAANRGKVFVEQQLDSAREQLTELRNVHNSLLTEQAQLAGERQSETLQLRNLGYEVGQLRDANAKLASENGSLQSQLSQASAKLADISDLQSEIEALQYKLRTKDSQLRDASQQSIYQQKDLQRASEEIAYLKSLLPDGIELEAKPYSAPVTDQEDDPDADLPNFQS